MLNSAPAKLQKAGEGERPSHHSTMHGAGRQQIYSDWGNQEIETIQELVTC